MTTAAIAAIMYALLVAIAADGKTYVVQASNGDKIQVRLTPSVCAVWHAPPGRLIPLIRVLFPTTAKSRSNEPGWHLACAYQSPLSL